MPNTLTAEKPISPATSARDVRYDLLRIVAACMVVLLHTAGAKWDAVPHNSLDWAALNVYNSLVRAAVPLFFMLSGAFLLKKEINIKKLYLKKILPLTVIYVVWSCLYAVDTVGLTYLFRTSPVTLIKTAVESHYHLWFIPALIGLYILLPVLYAVVHYESGKYTRYILFCFFVWQILSATLSAFFPENGLIRSILGIIPVELTQCSGYMFLGHYLANQKQIRIKSRTALLLFFATAAFSAAITQIDALFKGEASDVLYSCFALPVFFEAILLFLCFQNIKTTRFSSPRASAVVTTLSSLTFGIYLIHPFILDKLETIFKLHPLSFSPILSVPAIMLILTVLSAAITLVMTRIPVIKRFWKL